MTAEIKHWLDSLDLHQYYPVLLDNGYKGLQECAYLTERDLDDLQITLPGHRRRILSNLPSVSTKHKSRKSFNNYKKQLFSDRTSTYIDENIPPPSGRGHRRSVDSAYLNMSGSRPTSSCEGIEPNPEELYDILPARAPMPHATHRADGYVSPDPITPPILPPKKKASLENIDSKLGIIPHRSKLNSDSSFASHSDENLGISPRGQTPNMAGHQKKRPVPKPRPSVIQKKPIPPPRTPRGSVHRSPHAEPQTPDESRAYEEVAEPEASDREAQTTSNLSKEQTVASNEALYEPFEVRSDNIISGMQSFSSGRPISNGQPDESKKKDDDLNVYDLQGPTNEKNSPVTTVDVYELTPESPPTETFVPTADNLIDLNLTPDINERIILGAESDLSKEETENLLNESLYADVKESMKKMEHSDYSDRQSSYTGVWEMTSGSRGVQLPFARSAASSVSDRDSSASHGEPPPAFPPPPLPPHYGHRDPPPTSPSLRTLPEAPPPPPPARKDISSGSEDGIPFIPPRPPHSAKPPATAPVCTRPPMSLPLGSRQSSQSMDNIRDSVTSLSDLAIARSISDVSNGVEGDSITAAKARIHANDPVSPTDTCAGGADANLERQTSEANVYSCEVFRTPSIPKDKAKSQDSLTSSEYEVTTRRKAPPPPPKKENPFKDYYDAEMGTYCLQQPVEDTSYMMNTTSGWESEDTLSDGGDFYEDENERDSIIDLATLGRQDSIPITMVPHNRITTKSGFLYKKSSGKSGGNPIKSSFKWQKRWVVFDSTDLKYYPSKEQHESHPYRFHITTLDRVYTFATDEHDELALWTSLIMQIVLESQTDDILAGGEMNDPDKEDFVKMEGAKGKRYVAVKKDKLCYYNTYNDFQAASPIHLIEMKIATVKEVPKSKTQLQLVTPYASYMLDYDTPEDASEWKDCFEEAIAEGLGDDSVVEQVYENQSNHVCAECGATDPKWASINLVITICKLCAGIHRSLPVQVTKVRSLRMDLKVWTKSLKQLFIEIGNENANNFWEWSGDADKISPTCEMATRRKYIFDKYQRKKFYRKHPLFGDQLALNKALCKSAQYDDVCETMQLVFSGADVLYSSSGDSSTPLQIAKNANKIVQMEFLYQNGAEGSGNLPPSSGSPGIASVILQASAISYKGYLHKTGPNLKSDFLKRYVVLEHNILTYSVSEDSKQAKDSIEKIDMLSVTATSDDRYEFTFELATKKANGRVYLFAAETQTERQRWVNYLAKTITTVPEVQQEDIVGLDRGGLVYLRDGASSKYRKCWIHVTKRKLHLYNPETSKFESIDLLRITGIKMLQNMDNACGDVQELGTAFVIDLKNRALYIQADLKKETDEWYRYLKKAALEGGSTLTEQQLTPEDIPVIVDKCINFVEANGIETEGIYRVNGQHGKVTKLLEDFNSDALSVHLKLDTTNVVHDVATALKRFFRSLEEPLMTGEFHSQWIATACEKEVTERLKDYEKLMDMMPKVNQATLRRLVLHLVKVASFSDKNKMGSTNLASIFGPILINVDKPSGDSPRGFGNTNKEIVVLKDLIENQSQLFKVQTIDRKKEQKIQEAMERINQLQHPKANINPNDSAEMLIAIYVNEKNDENVVTMKVSGDTTALQVQQEVMRRRGELCPHGNLITWGLFEVICSGELYRPIHYNDKVLEIQWKWSSWPQEYSIDNHFCLKENLVYKEIDAVCDATHFSLFGELRFSDKAKFKHFAFEFSQSKLSYSKEKANQQCSWNVEDLVIYVGCQSARRSPNKFNFTFVHRTETIAKTRETPYFGHTVCCENKDELYRWIAAMLRAQHPEGLVPNQDEATFTPSHFSQLELETLVPMNAGARSVKSKSLFQKWKSKAKR